jgi:hypothetical protein
VPNGNQMGCNGSMCFIDGAIPIKSGAAALVIGLPAHFGTSSMENLSTSYQGLANSTGAEVHVFGRGRLSGKEWSYLPNE